MIAMNIPSRTLAILILCFASLAGEDAKVPEKSTPAFIASKTSEVFHEPKCHFVVKIKSENRVEYTNRDAAIKSGKRPCKVCNP